MKVCNRLSLLFFSLGLAHVGCHSSDYKKDLDEAVSPLILKWESFQEYVEEFNDNDEELNAPITVKTKANHFGELNAILPEKYRHHHGGE